jgi:phosphopantothenate-cysteine ligase/phosphopantothenoylcysteine decarboxylase/phosphopantothenate--cysteine ligase
MNLLVTAGNTQTPIDQVRCITNIFTGRTGGKIAVVAHARGHRVCLLTSHPEVLRELAGGKAPVGEGWQVRSYRTFEDLQGLMAEEVPRGQYDAIIHCAAVSDYELAGAYVAAPETAFDRIHGTWSAADASPRLVDASAGKVKSSHGALWLRLTPTPKLVDRIREPWGFRGVLVKFKLEVGVSEPELLQIAERSRLQSQADLMCANTLEGMHLWAFVGPLAGKYERIPRRDLAERLVVEVESRCG